MSDLARAVPDAGRSRGIVGWLIAALLSFITVGTASAQEGMEL